MYRSFTSTLYLHEEGYSDEIEGNSKVLIKKEGNFLLWISEEH